MLLLPVLFAACSKEHTTNNIANLADGDCQYKVNGNLTTMCFHNVISQT